MKSGEQELQIRQVHENAGKNAPNDRDHAIDDDSDEEDERPCCKSARNARRRCATCMAIQFKCLCAACIQARRKDEVQALVHCEHEPVHSDSERQHGLRLELAMSVAGAVAFSVGGHHHRGSKSEQKRRVAPAKCACPCMDRRLVNQKLSQIDHSVDRLFRKLDQKRTGKLEKCDLKALMIELKEFTGFGPSHVDDASVESVHNQAVRHHSRPAKVQNDKQLKAAITSWQQNCWMESYIKPVLTAAQLTAERPGHVSTVYY